MKGVIGIDPGKAGGIFYTKLRRKTYFFHQTLKFRVLVALSRIGLRFRVPKDAPAHLRKDIGFRVNYYAGRNQYDAQPHSQKESALAFSPLHNGVHRPFRVGHLGGLVPKPAVRSSRLLELSQSWLSKHGVFHPSGKQPSIFYCMSICLLTVLFGLREEASLFRIGSTRLASNKTADPLVEAWFSSAHKNVRRPCRKAPCLYGEQYLMGYLK